MAMTPHPLSRRQILLDACLAWYNERPDAARRVKKVLQRAPGEQLSLRVVEFFLSTHLREEGHDLYWAYQRHLRIFGKASFDVFCREPKQSHKLLGNSVKVDSTPAQLEFMRWFIESGAMQLLEDNLAAVLAAKQKHQSNAKRRKKKEKKATSGPAPASRQPRPC